MAPSNQLSGHKAKYAKRTDSGFEYGHVVAGEKYGVKPTYVKKGVAPTLDAALDRNGMATEGAEHIPY